MDALLRSLRHSGYGALLRSAADSVARTAGLPPESISVKTISENRAYRFIIFSGDPTEMVYGEILFKEGRCFTIRAAGNELIIFEIHHHTAASAIDEFANDVKSAVQLQLDGRRVRGMSFDWSDFVPGYGARLSYAGEGRSTPEPLQTRSAQFTEDELTHARRLSEASSRRFLVQLSRDRKILEEEATRQVSSETLGELVSCGLVQTEYLLRCRDDSHEITRVASLDPIRDADFKCATCGRSFSDELQQRVYSVTSAARGMIDGSHWMSIWITDLLVDAGVPLEAIEWNAASSGDEIDLVVSLGDAKIFLELKDRDFGLGDAYRFVPRLARHGGDFGVVVTTDAVEDEALKHMNEQARIRSVSQVTENPQQIAAEVDQLSRRIIAGTVHNLDDELALNPSQVLSEWMAQWKAPASPDEGAVELTVVEA